MMVDGQSVRMERNSSHDRNSTIKSLHLSAYSCDDKNYDGSQMNAHDYDPAEFLSLADDNSDCEENSTSNNFIDELPVIDGIHEHGSKDISGLLESSERKTAEDVFSWEYGIEAIISEKKDTPQTQKICLRPLPEHVPKTRYRENIFPKRSSIKHKSLSPPNPEKLHTRRRITPLVKTTSTSNDSTSKTREENLKQQPAGENQDHDDNLINSFSCITDFLNCTPAAEPDKGSDENNPSNSASCCNSLLTCVDNPNGLSSCCLESSCFPCNSPTPENKNVSSFTNETKSEGLDSSSPQTLPKTAIVSKSTLEIQIEDRLRKSIESIIIELIGSTIENAQYWMKSLFDFFCRNSTQTATSSGSIISPQSFVNAKCKKKAVVQNRNVMLRQRAARRIQRLRNSGLNREFSLSPVPTGVGLESTYDNQDLNGKQTKVLADGIAPKAKSTSFVYQLSQPYPIAATRSADQISLQSRFMYDLDDRDVKTDISTHSWITSDSSISFLDTLWKKKISGSRSQSQSLPTFSAVNSYESSNGLYYDSDPGNFPSSSSHSAVFYRPISPENEVKNADRQAVNNYKRPDWSDKSVKSLPVYADNAESETSTIPDAEVAQLTSPRVSIYSNIPQSLLGTIDVGTFDINNFSLVSEFIKELKNGNVSLIWHPGSNAQTNTIPPPIHVESWLEMGSRLKSSIIQPKFSWRSKYEADNCLLSPRSKRICLHTLHSIELLDIVRILKPTTIDRKIYPFARQECSFTIFTNSNDKFHFETARKDECDRFVYGLKLAVARLASRIIVGDDGVFDEFFCPWGELKKKRKKNNKKSKKKHKLCHDNNGAKGFKEDERNGINFLTAQVEEESLRKDELWGGADL